MPRWMRAPGQHARAAAALRRRAGQLDELADALEVSLDFREARRLREEAGAHLRAAAWLERGPAAVAETLPDPGHEVGP